MISKSNECAVQVQFETTNCTTQSSITTYLIHFEILVLIIITLSILCQLGEVSYHDFRGIFTNEEEKESIVKDLGDKNKVPMILQLILIKYLLWKTCSRTWTLFRCYVVDKIWAGDLYGRLKWWAVVTAHTDRMWIFYRACEMKE